MIYQLNLIFLIALLVTTIKINTANIQYPIANTQLVSSSRIFVIGKRDANNIDNNWHFDFHENGLKGSRMICVVYAEEKNKFTQIVSNGSDKIKEEILLCLNTP